MTESESIVGAAARAHGARMAVVEGMRVADHFGDVTVEYRVLREGAAIVDLALDGVLCVTGSDRQDFLHGMLSNDIKACGVGTGCRAFALTDQGKVVADVVVLVDDDTVVLLGAATGVTAVVPALERYLVADDVELLPRGSTDHVFGLFGPGAPGAVAALGAPSVPTGDYDHVAWAVDDAVVRLARVPAPGDGGYLCGVPAAKAVAWWRRAVEAGAAQPVGHQAHELWRIESGVARFGRDITNETLALETPFEDAVSFRKGCYLGQEIVERVTARGKVNRRLVGLVLAANGSPHVGDRLLSGDREVGRLTSVAWSWDRQCPVALGYVRREHLDPGTELGVRTGSGTIAAKVAVLPLA